MFFDKLFYGRTQPFDWQQSRILRLAEFSDRTNSAFRIARETNERAEIEKRGIIRGRMFFGNERGRTIPKYSLAGARIDWNSQIEKTGENASAVGFDNRDRQVECERPNRVRGVAADSRKLPHFVDALGTSAAMSIYDKLGRCMKIPRARIIAQTLPGVKHFAFGGASECRESWEPAQPLFVKRHDRCDLSLLKHELRNENRVRIACSSPRQVAAMATVPAEKRALKGSLFCHVERSRDISRCFLKQEEIPRLRLE